MLFLPLVLLAMSIGLPLYYTWRLLRLDAPSRIAFLLQAGEATILVTLVMMVSRWDVAGLYTLYLLAALFVLALMRAVWRHRRRPWRAPDLGAYPPGYAMTRNASLILFGAALLYIFSARCRPPALATSRSRCATGASS